MIFNILVNTTELYMTKYIIGEIFSSVGATLYKNPSDQTVYYWLHILELFSNLYERNFILMFSDMWVHDDAFRCFLVALINATWVKNTIF